MTARTKKKIKTAAKVDVYQVVTDRILEALEAGYVPWHRPWKTRTDGPLSLSTRRPYRGVNVFLLHYTAHAKGYASPWWGTYRQIAERGGQVRKGEKATTIVYWRMIEKKDAVENVVERIPLLRVFHVFNVDQCDGEMRIPKVDDSPLADHEPLDVCQAITTRYLALNGPTLDHGGNRASYSPTRDAVRMPLIGQFESPEAYHATLFHELVHSTGHSSRFARPSLVEPTPFGTPDYSREELVAEMGAAFLCGEAGIDVNYPQHAAYLDSWMKALRDDAKLLVQAAGAAQKAADLIVGPREEITEEEED